MNRLIALEKELSRYYHPAKKRRYLASATACTPAYARSAGYLPQAFTAVTGIFRPQDISRMKAFLQNNAAKTSDTKAG
jgi:hypothetical protein